VHLYSYTYMVSRLVITNFSVAFPTCKHNSLRIRVRSLWSKLDMMYYVMHTTHLTTVILLTIIRKTMAGK